MNFLELHNNNKRELECERKHTLEVQQNFYYLILYVLKLQHQQELARKLDLSLILQTMSK